MNHCKHCGCVVTPSEGDECPACWYARLDVSLSDAPTEPMDRAAKVAVMRADAPRWRCFTCTIAGRGDAPAICPACTSERDERHGPAAI